MTPISVLTLTEIPSKAPPVSPSRNISANLGPFNRDTHLSVKQLVANFDSLTLLMNHLQCEYSLENGLALIEIMAFKRDFIEDVRVDMGELTANGIDNMDEESYESSGGSAVSRKISGFVGKLKKGASNRLMGDSKEIDGLEMDQNKIKMMGGDIPLPWDDLPICSIIDSPRLDWLSSR